MAFEDAPPFSVPEGFSVQKVADDGLVHDCFCMTLDGLRRPVVSGPGYISTLIDDDSDGKFDRSILWSNIPKQGAQGLWSEGRSLYFVSEGSLWHTEDNDSNLAADPNAKRVLELPTGGEHDAHAIRRGPDGFWYLIAGNFARDISKLQNDPNSPVSRSRSGTIWRISPDFASRSVWAHGMRNCYDFDFMPDGQIVTYDSDCEREASLPWYRPTRVMVLGPASDAGWCGASWKDEDHRITMPLTLAQLGRGSPTGVAVYQHRTFPRKYHQAIFALDWTFGRVLAIYPSKNLDESQRIPNKVPAEVFMQPTGNAGFAPTDICVADDGSLLICVGGRGTSGAIYRVISNEIPSNHSELDWLADAVAAGKLKPKQATALNAIFTSPMPFESWSEAKWRGLVDNAGFDALLGIIDGSIAMQAPDAEVAGAKLRCAQLLTRLNANVPLNSIQNALNSPSRSTRAAAWWLMGRGRIAMKPQDTKWIAALAGADYSSPEFNSQNNEQTHWEEHLGPADERLRWEAFGLRKWPMGAANSRPVADNDAGNTLRRTWLWALARSGSPLAKKSDQNALDSLIAKQLFGSNSANLDTYLLDALANFVPNQHARWGVRDRLEFLTVLQSGLGDRRFTLPQQQDPPQPNVLDGYRAISASRLPENVRNAWIGWTKYFSKQAIASDSPLVHLEATRTLAMLEPNDAESLNMLLDQITESSHPTSDIHWLCCAANCSSKRSSQHTLKTAQSLSGIVRKVKSRGLYTDNQWPIRLQQLVSALLKRDNRLGNAFVDLPVPCCPEDIVLLSSFPVDVQADARKKMRQHLMDTPISEWTPAILRYASQIGIDGPFAIRLREAVTVNSLRGLAVELLATLGQDADYDLFLTSLESNDKNQWVFAWNGLHKLPIKDANREWRTLAPVLSSVLNTVSSLPRTEILSRMKSLGAQLKFALPANSEQWQDWDKIFKQTLDSETLDRLYRPNSVSDWRAVVQSAAGIAGDPQQGKAIYQEKCALCHGGQSSLGPSLSGVTKRFSREDLSRAIFEPSRDISDRYRAIRVLTVDGELYTGMNIYNAADGITLQTANGTMVRINQDNIEEKAYSTESIMPSGLMDGKSPTDVAHLYAYLSTQ
jgi:putative heme-binding domain-containing protein